MFFKSAFSQNINLDESKILLSYRFISLLLTAAFYLIGYSEDTVFSKVFTLVCLFLSGIILSYLYIIYQNSSRNIKLLLLIETIANSVLLIPTEGIKSPFIWYSLNTVLISSMYLKKRYCWINVFMYFFSCSLIDYYVSGDAFIFFNLVIAESNYSLSFLLFIAAVQFWSVYVKRTKEKSIKLEEANKQLESANQRILESVNHIKALYQSVNLLTNQGSKDVLIKLLFEHVKNITQTETVFFYDISDNAGKMTLKGNMDLEKPLEANISKDLVNILEKGTPKKIYAAGRGFTVVPLRSSNAVYGLLGLENVNKVDSAIYKDNVSQLQFLSELISTAMERLSLLEIRDRLIVSEEQNRIANEIHDSVLQRLFSMSCGIFSLIKGLGMYNRDELEQELNNIRKTTDNVMKELREKIYGLSWKKSGNNSFVTDINKYINDVKKYNSVDISFVIKGDDELLSFTQKEAIYRIICEGISNAVRHGKAKKIDVSLIINTEYSIVNVIDNGIGFEIIKVMQANSKGLGIKNMHQLTESLHGKIYYDTKPGKGTKIEIILPNNILIREGERAII